MMAVCSRFLGVETVFQGPFVPLHQNGGSLSKRARTREFSKLTDKETKTLERAYAKICMAAWRV